MTDDTCTHRDYGPDDDDFATGPRCTAQAEYTTCEPRSGRVCAAHRCRCSRPLYDVRRATRDELQAAERRASEERIAVLTQERDQAIHDKLEAQGQARMWEAASNANRSEIESWAADSSKAIATEIALRAVIDKLPKCEVDSVKGPCSHVATVRFSGLGGIDEYRCDDHRVRVDFDLPYATELRALPKKRR